MKSIAYKWSIYDMGEKKKILITVKTYPNLSSTYEELVCTAGILEDGSWIRLYPIPFRLMEYEKQYKKYQWIEVEVIRRKQDIRPESFEPRCDTIQVLDKQVDTRDNWRERKKYVLKNVYRNMTDLIDMAHNNKVSLAVFKPEQFVRFEPVPVKEKERIEYQAKMEKILSQRKQMELIDDDARKINPVAQPDYQFYYVTKDANGKESRMQIEDWEIHALYRKCHKKHGSKEKAVADVRKKYWDDFARTKDLYLFLGTTLKFHVRKTPNPFTIIGTFSPKKECQNSLLE